MPCRPALAGVRPADRMECLSIFLRGPPKGIRPFPAPNSERESIPNGLDDSGRPDAPLGCLLGWAADGPSLERRATVEVSIGFYVLDFARIPARDESFDLTPTWR